MCDIGDMSICMPTCKFVKNGLDCGNWVWSYLKSMLSAFEGPLKRWCKEKKIEITVKVSRQNDYEVWYDNERKNWEDFCQTFKGYIMGFNNC